MNMSEYNILKSNKVENKSIKFIYLLKYDKVSKNYNR